MHIGYIHQQFFKQEVTDPVVSVYVEEKMGISDDFKQTLHDLEESIAGPNGFSCYYLEEIAKTEKEPEKLIDTQPRKRGRPRKSLPILTNVNKIASLSTINSDKGTDRVLHVSQDSLEMEMKYNNGETNDSCEVNNSRKKMNEVKSGYVAD